MTHLSPPRVPASADYGESLLRAMTPDDLAFVLGIQQACYPPSMNEAATTILGRLAEAPKYAWIAMLSARV